MVFIAFPKLHEHDHFGGSVAAGNAVPGALIARVDCATTCRYAGFLHLRSCTASNRYVSLPAVGVEMALQRFPALVVVFIEAVGGLQAPLGNSHAEGRLKHEGLVGTGKVD